MRLGLFFMPCHPPGKLHAETYQEDLKVLGWGDELGYSEAWIAEHHTLPWENVPAPDLFVARAIGETEQITLGTGVVLLPFHNPIHVAHRIAMLDHLAKGRFYFGIGSGGAPSEYEMYGMDVQLGNQRAMMRESIELIIRLWTEEEPFEHRGEFYSAKVPQAQPELGMGYHMRPFQKPHPPVAVAGFSPNSGTLEIAGEKGWWPMSSNFLHSSLLSKHWEAMNRGMARTGERVSRNDWRISRLVYVAETSEKARQDAIDGPLSGVFADYFRPIVGLISKKGDDQFKLDLEMPDEAITSEYMIDEFWIVGNPDDCVKKIRKLYQDVGGFGVLLTACLDWGTDSDKWFRSLELMAKDVLPAIQDLTPT